MSNTNAVENISGHCQCGGVRYQARAARRQLIQCHCEMCRRAVGGIWMATQALREDLTIEDDGCLEWYQSSEHGRRGFCNSCGASLFFDREGRPTMSIAVGTVDQPSGFEFAAHCNTADAADYEIFTDDLPKFPDGQHGIEFP